MQTNWYLYGFLLHHFSMVITDVFNFTWKEKSIKNKTSQQDQICISESGNHYHWNVRSCSGLCERKLPRQLQIDVDWSCRRRNYVGRLIFSGFPNTSLIKPEDTISLSWWLVPLWISRIGFTYRQAVFDISFRCVYFGVNQDDLLFHDSTTLIAISTTTSNWSSFLSFLISSFKISFSASSPSLRVVGPTIEPWGTSEGTL